MINLGKYDMLHHNKAKSCWGSLQENFCQPPELNVSEWINLSVDYRIAASLEHVFTPINFMELENDPEAQLERGIEGPSSLALELLVWKTS